MISGTCPVCGGTVPSPGPLVPTEIVVCPECQSMLVVESLREGAPLLGEAPKIEEDWGE
jgi:lysine biosynthesis protein LysW